MSRNRQKSFEFLIISFAFILTFLVSLLVRGKRQKYPESTKSFEP